jgi:hypothetical protein
MNRKSLWFIFMAALAALMIFAGCPTDGGSDDGPDGTGDVPSVPGGGGGSSVPLRI